MGIEKEEVDSSTLIETREKLQKPRLYKILLHNDDYTTMEFVVHVLMEIFKKSQATATHIMLSVHEKGVGVAGIYTYEVAETKMKQVQEYTKEKEFPLRCSMERA